MKVILSMFFYFSYDSLNIPVLFYFYCVKILS